MDQLKKALQKAGMFSSEQTRGKAKERQRKEIALDAERKGHEIRNQCEHCEEFRPNVEQYAHKNRILRGTWLCVKCADAFNVSDDLRNTMQSPDSRSGMFNRQYGHTRKSLAEKGPPKKVIRVGR
ncbi:MAG: hypothetical protein HYV02_01505 [Deltaproteobacteria bacterium]|nr:hypothetical protein [Deltaproteobacteria bacterium]